jgi:chromosome segregation ATPase
MPKSTPAQVLRLKADEARRHVDRLSKAAADMESEAAELRKQVDQWRSHADYCERGANILEQSPDFSKFGT